MTGMASLRCCVSGNYCVFFFFEGQIKHESISPDMSLSLQTWVHSTQVHILTYTFRAEGHCWGQQKGFIKKRSNAEQCEGKVGSCGNVPLFWILGKGNKGIAAKKSVLYLVLERLHSHKNIKISHKKWIKKNYINGQVTEKFSAISQVHQIQMSFFVHNRSKHHKT